MDDAMMEDSMQNNLKFEDETQEMDDPENSLDAEFVDFRGETEVVDYPEDMFQSQCVEHVLAGETQVLGDFEDVLENRVKNHEGETQVGEDHDCSDHLRSQLINDCCDQGVIHFDRKLGNEAACKEIMQCTSFCKKKQDGFKEIDIQQQSSSGYSQPSFTSVRAASLCASGLAAHQVAFDQSDNKLCCMDKKCSSLEQPGNNDNGTSSLTCFPKIGDEVHHVLDLRECDKPKEVCSGVECTFNYSPARKLVTENALFENKESTNEVCGTPRRADLDLLPAHDNGLAGLSYIDSQEPGDLSQASALGFVDKFLDVNDFGFTNELDRGRPTDPVPESCVKGSLILAKRVKSKDTIRQVGAFDWDDNQEDERGGDFFSRMKDEICKSKTPGQRNLPRSQNSKLRATEQIKQKVKQSKASNGKMDSTDSDSRLILLSSKETENTVKASETNIKRNLAKELNECLDKSSIRGSAEPYTGNNMLGVGPDTQIAAEAMEVLFHGEPLAKCDPYDDYNGMGSCECLPGEKRGNEVSPELCYIPKRCKACPDSGVVTQKSRIKKRNHARIKEHEHDEGAPKRSCLDRVTTSYSITKSKGYSWSPSIDQTKGPSMLVQSTSAEKSSKNSTEKGSHRPMTGIPRYKRNRGATGVCTLKLLNNKEKSSKSGHQSGKVEDIGLGDHDSEVQELSLNTHSLSVDAVWYPRRTRSHRCPPGQGKGSCTLHGSSILDQKDSMVTSTRQKRSEILAGNNVGPPNETRAIGASNKSDWKNDEYCTLPYGCDDAKARLELRPRVRAKPSNLACLTPAKKNCDAFSCCQPNLGNEASLFAKSGVMKEINFSGLPNSTFPSRNSRRRREMTDVRVLFSRHLDEDIIKQQKKILSRLGASVASSMSDATHFIADEFARTRNMLESIAFGKPVVSHLWLESCNQTNCFIDEKSYILRDEKKEKEFGFSMPLSLARSCQNPLLQNRRVLISPNVKPGKDIITSLVKAVNGQIVEGTGSPTLKEIVIPDDLLVVSCEEDYAICEHFRDKGVPVYSSELILNGIVTQRLDYERYRLFEDRVLLKRTHLSQKTVLSCN